MPLATTGSYVGIIVLPGIVEVFLNNYGLHATFCMFGALAYNTIPCGLVLSDVRSGKQSTEGSGVQSRRETIPSKLRRIESNIQSRAEEGSSGLEAVMAVKSEITYPSNSQSETNNVQDKLNTDRESNNSNSGVQSRSETIPSKLRRIEDNIQSRAEEGSSGLEAVMAVKSEITYPSNSQSETNNVQDKLNTDREKVKPFLPNREVLKVTFNREQRKVHQVLKQSLQLNLEITYPSNSQSETNDVQDKLNTDRESNNSNSGVQSRSETIPFKLRRIESNIQSRAEEEVKTIPFKLRRIESNIQSRAEEGSSSLEAVMAVKSEITYPSISQSETNNVQDKLNTDRESNNSNSGVQSRSETIPSKQRGIESNIQSRAEKGSSSLEAVIAVKSEITYPSNSQSETNNVQDKLNTDRESNNSKIQTTTNPFAAERIIQTVKSIKSFIQTFLVQFKLFGDVVFTLYFITVNMRKFPSNSWTLFLIPLSQELGVTKQTAVIISAIGGVGGIMGRFLAAVSFKVSKTISPLTLFATYYLCDAFIFALFPTTTNVILLGICAFFSGLLLSAKAGMTSGILLHLTTAETFRQAFGLVDCGCGVYSLLTGFISGASYDVYGSFKNLFRISALVCAISCIFVIFIIFLQKLKKKKHSDSENGEDSD
ncbi:hypothetical protein BSL78_13996 [Apostichopus japonicus]|uniref:Uncharacterized protein n=1 Tax=Stichopus japonicus TaxID=307972 RepID=A0A2G8KMC9_STIJA|nr:hypothetical protein BSL78_13996 [Apostichopus japonicus]